MVSVKELEQFFFRAMRQGWAFGGKAEPVPGLPGYKDFWHREPDRGLVLLDRYCVARNGCNTKTCGTTTIWHNDVPVWTMHYGGQCEDVAIPCLRAALQDAYEAELFFGGRGTDGFMYEKLAYENCDRDGCSTLGTFENFEGEEHIYVSGGEEFGLLWYKGGTLLA
ncbi:MAG: DUF5680 domain-containing protein [Parcubacteria group bacterium]